jgi:DNA-binding XRE family transcriptional regulator
MNDVITTGSTTQMTVQIIEHEGHPAFVVVPIAEWETILTRLEERQDIADARAAHDTENLPAALVDRLLDGDEHPLRVWRSYRGMTLAQLAGKVGGSRQMLSMVETGRSQASVDLLGRLARTLDCDMDDIVV